MIMGRLEECIQCFGEQVINTVGMLDIEGILE